MAKPIKSRDPRKPRIVAELKRASNCRKVTNVRELSPGVYEGSCMWPNGEPYTLGLVTVEIKEGV